MCRSSQPLIDSAASHFSVFVAVPALHSDTAAHGHPFRLGSLESKTWDIDLDVSGWFGKCSQRAVLREQGGKSGKERERRKSVFFKEALLRALCAPYASELSSRGQKAQALTLWSSCLDSRDASAASEPGVLTQAAGQTQVCLGWAAGRMHGPAPCGCVETTGGAPAMWLGPSALATALPVPPGCCPPHTRTLCLPLALDLNVSLVAQLSYIYLCPPIRMRKEAVFYSPSTQHGIWHLVGLLSKGFHSN